MDAYPFASANQGWRVLAARLALSPDFGCPSTYSALHRADGDFRLAAGDS